MSVNDISGIPILEVSSNDTVKMGTFGNEALVVEGDTVTSNILKVTNGFVLPVGTNKWVSV
jgi:hypothetical protein